MKKFLLLAALCLAATAGAAEAGVVKTSTVLWRTYKAALPAPGYIDSTYRATSLVNVSDTTAAWSLQDWDFPNDGVSNTDTAYTFIQFAMIPKNGGSVAVTADTLYITPQISYGEDTWHSFTSVPSLVVLEVGTSNTFVFKMNQSTVNTPALKAGIVGASAIRFIVQTSNDSPFGEYVGRISYPRIE